jgi:signal transduction histidine kinase
MTTRPRRRLSLVILSLAAGSVAGLVVVGLSAWLVAASREFRRSTQLVEEARRAVGFSVEVDRLLREHQRVGNVWVATREPYAAETVSAIGSDLGGFMTELEQHVLDSVDGITSETQLLAETYEHINAYLAEYEAAQARELTLEEMVRRVRPSFERALASCASMRRHYEARLTLAAGEAERVLQLESLLMIASGLILVVGSVVVTLGARVLVLRPLLDLRGAMARFRRGDSVARAGDARLSEVSELAATFNEMADAIVQTRRDQVTFLAAVAHDLRSPLQALKMGVHVLARETKPIAPQRCARLERQIDRLTRMVGDLLDATRIEAGELALHLTEFDLRTAAQAMIDLFTPTATEHGITLKAPDRAVLIRGDSLRIEQVISNLLSNAIKYSPAGGPVEVAVSQTDREAELSVSDRGWGIPAEEIANMFLPFRRLPATSQIRGVGLGLSVVARIVSAHGGRIEVESTPGVGSTFRVRLPLAAV